MHSEILEYWITLLQNCMLKIYLSQTILVKVLSVACAAIFIRPIPIRSKWKGKKKIIQKQPTIWTLYVMLKPSNKWVYIWYVLSFVLMCFFRINSFFFCEHTKKENAKWNYFESDQPNDNNNIIFFVHYSVVVIGRIQGRCECTYICTGTSNNTLTENQNEQIATTKKREKLKK